MKKEFSAYDVCMYGFVILLICAGGLVPMWKVDNYWMLKCWFTYKVVEWAFNFIEDIYKDYKKHLTNGQ